MRLPYIEDRCACGSEWPHSGPTHGKAPMQPSAFEDDLDLIRRVVGRDRQAFETLYHRY
jgi:hypothetical protein